MRRETGKPGVEAVETVEAVEAVETVETVGAELDVDWEVGSVL